MRLSAIASAAVLCAGLSPTLIGAQGAVSDGLVRIGVLTDLSGLYSDFAGKGSVEAVRMAVEDFGGRVLGMPIEVVSADHQNKADVASAKAREWYDTGKVDVITNVVSSSTAIAVSGIARQKSRPVIVSGAYTSRLSNEDCSPFTVHYQIDTTALTNTPKAIVKMDPGSWYFLTADYVFGHTMERDARASIEAGGGKVVGSVKHPLAATDFSSFLLQAQASKARFIGLANAGGDTISSIRSAKEFGLTTSGKQQLVAMALFLNDVHALTLPVAQGIYTTASFYWDRDPASRAWSEKFFKRMGKMPSEVQAADYSAAMSYLRAVAAAGTDEPVAVMAQLRKATINDFFASNGRIREDGRFVKVIYLVQVKTPAESKRPWDYFHVRATIPGADAFLPLAKSSCSLVKKS